MSSTMGGAASADHRRRVAAAAVVLLALLPGYPGARPAPGADPVTADTVVLLHGLRRTPRSMRRLERKLAGAGYRVENIGYPSTKRSIEDLAGLLEKRLGECCAGEEGRVHFVTHSLGGIVLRYYAASRPFPRLGRAVMLSPPNGGSELIDLLLKIPLVRHAATPAHEELGTGPGSVPRTLGPVDFEVGIITGNRSLLPIFSWVIPGPDDGLVAVERARVEGMADFLVVPHTHTFIMNGNDVLEQTLRFLREGSFDHGEEGA